LRLTLKQSLRYEKMKNIAKNQIRQKISLQGKIKERELSLAAKKRIDVAVKKVKEEYGETLKMFTMKN